MNGQGFFLKPKHPMKTKDLTPKGLLEKAQAVQIIQAKIDALNAERVQAETEQATYAREFFAVTENVPQAFLVENDTGAFSIEYDPVSPSLSRIKALKR